MIRVLCIRAIVLALFLAGAVAIGRAQDLAITRATVYAAPDAPARRDVTIVIRHGVIAGVGEHLRIPKGMETISCEACVVLAGFWNAHVHFMEPQWNEAANQPADKLARQISEMLTHSGFTTVVDTGSDGENTIALRRRVDSGEVRDAHLYRGHPYLSRACAALLLSGASARIEGKMAQPETAADAVTIVDKNRAAGCDIVKLFTGSIVRPGHITPMQVAIARAAVDEAHRHGQLVFSHSSNLEGTKVAIDAGVDVLAHTPEVTSGIDEAMLRRMIAQHMTIIPTLKLFSGDDKLRTFAGSITGFTSLGEGWFMAPTPGFSRITTRARNFAS